MKGTLRVYDDGDTFKCKLNWTTVRENYLNFFEDKKSVDPISFINLSGCMVKKIFNNTYNANMIEITTPQNNKILLTPDNNKEFNKWLEVLQETSQRYRDSYQDQQPAVKMRNSRNIVDNTVTPPRISSRNSNPKLSDQNARNQPNNIGNQYPNGDHVVDHRQRNLHPEHNDRVPEPSNGYRRSSGQAPSIIGHRGSMNDPMRQNKTKREYSENFIKANNVQLPNKHYKKPDSMYNDRRESKISGISGFRGSRAIETVKEDPMMSDDEILETMPLEELRRKYPVSDKAKRWSIAATDLVGKSNDELFLMLIQLNREKSHMGIWKETLEQYIDEIDEKLKDRLSMQTVNELENNRSQYVDQLNHMEYMMNLAQPLISFMDSVVQMSDAYAGNNDAFHVVYHECPPTGKEDFTSINFIRHNQEKQVAKLINENQTFGPSGNSIYRSTLPRDAGSDKENDAAVLLNLNNTEEFLSRKTGLNEIIEEISSQLKELEPMKNDIQNFVEHIDDESEAFSREINGTPNINSKGSIKSVKNLKDSEGKAKNAAFMPRRSTRKAPKSDMEPSIKRKENLKVPGSLGSRSQNASLRYGQYSPNEAKNSLGVNLNVGRRSFHAGSAVENDFFADPVRVEPLAVTPRSQKSRTLNTNKSDSFARSTSSQVQNQLRDLMRTDPYTEPRTPSPIYRAPSSILGLPDEQSGPLIKLNANLFQNPHGPKRAANIDNVVAPPVPRMSISDSDISASSHRINQRLNLNQFVDDNKNWKNPGRDDSNTKLSTPEKLNIGERYRASITDDDQDDMDGPRSRKMRQLVANESFSRLTNEDVGQQNHRESMLLTNSKLAQEASRKSRNLQKI